MERAEQALWDLANHPEQIAQTAPEASPQGVWYAMSEVRLSLDQGHSAEEALDHAELAARDMPSRDRASALLTLFVARGRLRDAGAAAAKPSGNTRLLRHLDG